MVQSNSEFADRRLHPRSRARGGRVGALALLLAVTAGCARAPRSHAPPSTPEPEATEEGTRAHASSSELQNSVTPPRDVQKEPQIARAASEQDNRAKEARPTAPPPSELLRALGQAESGAHRAKVMSEGAAFGAGYGRLAAGSSGIALVGGSVQAMKSRGVLSVVPQASPSPSFNTEGYAHITENRFLKVTDQPLSTFSIDVDTASYSNARRFITQGSLPPKDAIRLEEWVNYFAYDYAPPDDEKPFAVNAEVASCPWNAEHRLVRIGLKGKVIDEAKVPPRNLVFLIDVSGSMMEENKLPLVKQGLGMLVDRLRPEDTIALVAYAGASGLVLPATSGRERGTIRAALERLEAGGSTNGGDGIRLAYAVAQRSFRKSGINRVILATDGDFNVGTTSEGELQRLIEEKRNGGVFLTVLGFGMGNVKDSTMEMLADKGNGNYAYIDSANEAQKVLVREAGSTLVTIAKDVKLQVELNPKRVASYKLLGYEDRLLAKEDFNDDKKDAGEIGAGHSVTALYEIVPNGVPSVAVPEVSPLKYQGTAALSAAAQTSELLTVSVRYKPVDSDTSVKFAVVVNDDTKPLEQTSNDYRFGVAVADVALLLRGSPDVKTSNLEFARALAAGALGADAYGDRRAFLSLVDQAIRLRASTPRSGG